MFLYIAASLAAMFLFALLLTHLEALLLILFSPLARIGFAFFRHGLAFLRECLLGFGGRSALSEFAGGFALSALRIGSWLGRLFGGYWLGEAKVVPSLAYKLLDFLGRRLCAEHYAAS